MTPFEISGIGFTNNGMQHVSPKEAYQLCIDGAVLIDVRESYHSFLHTFDVEQLFYCPNSELMNHLDQIPDDCLVILADAAGLKSIDAVKLLQEQGFKNVANLAGGILEWNLEGMPVKSDKSQRLSGSCMCMLKFREARPPTLPGKNSDL